MDKFRHSLVSLLADHTDAPYDPEYREFIEDVADALYERHEQFPRWPESVRDFYAIYDLNFQVGNGGFAQAAYNVPHLIFAAQAAFERLGRSNAARLCERTVTMLPAEMAEHAAKGFVGEETIEEVFAHFSDSELAALDHDLPDEFWVDDALQALVERQRGEFESVDRLG